MTLERLQSFLKVSRLIGGGGVGEYVFLVFLLQMLLSLSDHVFDKTRWVNLRTQGPFHSCYKGIPGLFSRKFLNIFYFVDKKAVL